MSICINNNIKQLNLIGIVNDNMKTNRNNCGSPPKNYYSEPKKVFISANKLKPENYNLNHNINKNSNYPKNIYDPTSDNIIKNIHIVDANNDIYSNANIINNNKITEPGKLNINYKMINNVYNRDRDRERIGSSTARMKKSSIIDANFIMDKRLNGKIRILNNIQEYSTGANTANSYLITGNKNNQLAASSHLGNIKIDYNNARNLPINEKYLVRQNTGRLVTKDYNNSISENKNYKNVIKKNSSDVDNLIIDTTKKINNPYNFQKLLDNKEISNLKLLKDNNNLDKNEYFKTPYFTKYEKLTNDTKIALRDFRSNTTESKKKIYRPSVKNNNDNIILINQDGVYLKEGRNSSINNLNISKKNIRKKNVNGPEEIHYFFVKSIQEGKELESEFNNSNF